MENIPCTFLSTSSSTQKNKPSHKKDQPSSMPLSINQQCLSNIIELTQQQEPQMTMISQRANNNKESDNRQKDNGDAKSSTFYSKNQQQNSWSCLGSVSNMMRKSLHCIKFTYTKIHKNIVSEDINIQQSQISEIITKLRRKKSRKLNLLPDLPEKQSQKRTLVLDLEQTLIFSTFKQPNHYDFSLQLEMKGNLVTLYIIKRFGLDSFIFQMSQLYQLVLFSSLKNEIVEKILQKIDPKKYFKNVLSRQHCIVINKSYYIKSVRDLGRDQKKIIVVDCHTISASLNPQNLYKIQPFKGSSKDRKLIKLSYFLKHIYENLQIKQMIPVELHRRRFQSKQIKIQEKQNIINRRKQNRQSREILKMKKPNQLQNLPAPESSISVLSQKN